MTTLARFRARFAARLKHRVARLPMLLLWLLALAVVAGLSRGRMVSNGLARGYAEPVDFAVGPLEAGLLAEVPVALGQPVKKGEVVARLSSTFVDAELAQARADLSSKRAAVAAERVSLESQVARSGIWVMKARASEQQDRAQLDEVNQRVTRLQGLVANQLAPRTELEDALRQLAALKARVATYDAALKVPGQAGARTFLSGDSRSFTESVDLLLEPRLRAVEEVEAAVRRLELRREALALKAPVDGTVSLVGRRPGEVVAAGAEVVRVVQPSAGRVLAFAPERLASVPRVGQAVRVDRPSSFSGARTGVVVELSGEVEQLPQRLWGAPQVPAFGRRLVVKVEDGEPLLPGEALDVQL